MDLMNLGTVSVKSEGTRVETTSSPRKLAFAEASEGSLC